MNRREMMLMTSAAAGAVALAALPTTTAARGPVRLQDVGRIEAIIINGNRYEAKPDPRPRPDHV